MLKRLEIGRTRSAGQDIDEASAGRRRRRADNRPGPRACPRAGRRPLHPVHRTPYLIGRPLRRRTCAQVGPTIGRKG